jgi:hypothetical protein
MALWSPTPRPMQPMSIRRPGAGLVQVGEEVARQGHPPAPAVGDRRVLGLREELTEGPLEMSPVGGSRRLAEGPAARPSASGFRHRVGNRRAVGAYRKRRAPQAGGGKKRPQRNLQLRRRNRPRGG